MQIVANAIESSKSNNGQVVIIDPIDAKQARVSMDAIRRELARECEQDVSDGDGYLTYEGKDIDGNKWRVAVPEQA